MYFIALQDASSHLFPRSSKAASRLSIAKSRIETAHYEAQPPSPHSAAAATNDTISYFERGNSVVLLCNALLAVYSFGIPVAPFLQILSVMPWFMSGDRLVAIETYVVMRDRHRAEHRAINEYY